MHVHMCISISPFLSLFIYIYREREGEEKGEIYKHE